MGHPCTMQRRTRWQVGPRVDVMGDAGRDHGQDVGGALAALVEPGEEPISSTEDQSAQLALAPVIGGLDVSVFEKEQEPSPLAVQVAEGLAERCLGRVDRALPVDPVAALVGDGPGARVATVTSLIGRVAIDGRLALDCEEPGDDAQTFERDRVTGSSRLDETAAAVRPESRALAAGPLEEGGDAGAVALHRAREVGTEEAFDAVGISRRRIEERHPSCVGPAPHGAVADAVGRIVVENGDARRVGAQQPGPRVWDSMSRATGASKSSAAGTLRPRVSGAMSTPACAKRVPTLDRLMLDVLVADGVDDERVSELAALDELRRRRRCDDAVVLGAGDGLVEPLLDDHASGDDVEDKARGEPGTQQGGRPGGHVATKSSRMGSEREPMVGRRRLPSGFSAPGRSWCLRAGTTREPWAAHLRGCVTFRPGRSRAESRHHAAPSSRATRLTPWRGGPPWPPRAPGAPRGPSAFRKPAC